MTPPTHPADPWDYVGCAIAMVVATLLLAACSLDGVVRRDVGPSTVIPPAEAPGREVRGVCIDSTDSVPADLVQGAIEALAAMVEGWVPVPADRGAGLEPVPALDLAVRKVLGGSSITPEGEVRHVQVPGVPGVMAKPAPTDVDFVTTNAAWRAQAHAADEATATAREVATAEAVAIREADWSATSSEISGCVSALGLTQRGPGARFVLVSDLDQNDPFQNALGNLNGAAMRIVHACAEAEVCADQEAQWGAAFMGQGAGTVEFSRPERVGVDVAEWLQAKGESS